MAVRAFGQPFDCQGWAQEVAAQVLELVAGGRGDGDIGMEGEALQARTARLVFVDDGGRRAQPADRVTGPRTAGDSLLDGGGGITSQERELLSHGIGGSGIFGQAPAAAQEAQQAVVDLLEQFGDVLVRRRGQRMKHRCRGGQGRVKTPSSTRECRWTLKIQGRAEALNDGHGAALAVGDALAPRGAPQERGPGGRL